MLKAIHAQESKKAAREKARAVIAELREMKLKEAAKKVEDGIEETLRLNPKFCVNSQRGENRAEFNVRGSGFIRLPLVCSITPAGMDVKGGGKAAVHRSAVQRRADPGSIPNSV